MMAVESKTVVPSTSTSVGICPIGLSASTSGTGILPVTKAETRSIRSPRPSSWAAIRTFLTNGDRDDHSRRIRLEPFDASVGDLVIRPSHRRGLSSPVCTSNWSPASLAHVGMSNISLTYGAKANWVKRSFGALV